MDNLSPEQIQAMITMLQGMLPKEDTERKPEESASYSEESAIKTAPSRKIQKTPSVNKFDEMMESKLHKADCAIDKKLQQFDPTPRTRAFTPVKVKCRVCGSNDEVNPVLLSDTAERYKCNKCSRSAG